MTSTGRHLDETQAGIPNAPSERADLYGQSYCERHQGQQPKGRTQRPDIWAHRSRMGSAKKESILDRGVVPHMGIPLPYTWLNPSTRPRVGPDLDHQKVGRKGTRTMTTKATRRHRKQSNLAIKRARKDKRRKARKAAK